MIEEHTKSWIEAQIELEKTRLKKLDITCLPLTVKNASIMVEQCPVSKELSAVNRIEIQTNFNFDSIKQILISDSVECPLKQGYFYVTVVMFTDKPVPILVPYLYHAHLAKEDGPVVNKLNTWLLINEQLHHSRHHVQRYQSVR